MASVSTLAALQTTPQAQMTVALDETLSFAQEAVAAGATFVGTPEYCGGLASDGEVITPPHADEDSHAYLNGVKQFAVDSGVWFLVGSVAITAPNGRIHNRGYLIDDHGQIRARYDKIHMFDIQLSADEVFRESATVEPGLTATVSETPIGKIGHTICYDLRFGHLYRDLARRGAEILGVPSAFLKQTGAAHWHVLNRARAIENGAFVFAPGLVGQVPGGPEVYGHSLIIDPWGQILAEGGEDPGIVMAEIDLDQVARVRARIPSLCHDRPFSVL
jgi:predicted amidohydrolase